MVSNSCAPKRSHNWARTNSHPSFHSFESGLLLVQYFLSIRPANVPEDPNWDSYISMAYKRKTISMNPGMLFINFNISELTFNQNAQWVLSHSKTLSSILFAVLVFKKTYFNWAFYNQARRLLAPLFFFFFFFFSSLFFVSWQL